MATDTTIRRRASRYGQPRVFSRAGSVMVEFLLVMPILLIVLLTVIQFGMLLANMQQLALACRVGAEAASKTGNLPNTGTVPPSITDAINQQLSSSGILYGAVILQHNVNGSTHTLATPDPLPASCSPPQTALPPTPPPATNYGRPSVRVTVCVPMTELAPNCLAIFGFDLSGRYAKCSTTFRYEG
jgi:Flp pilus assembly protein TadG